MNNPIPPVFLIINYSVAVILLIRLWKKNLSYVSKSIWSLILLIPFVGIIFYLAFFNPPPSLPPNKRQGVHKYVMPFTKKSMDRDHGVEK